jgi:integron integrase
MKDGFSASEQKFKHYKEFWQLYRAEVRKQGIPEAQARFLEYWARQFSLSLPKVPIQDRSAEDVKAFLDTLTSNPNVEDWQVSQAVEALKILYKYHLKLEWAQKDLNGEVSETAFRKPKTAEISKDDQTPQERPGKAYREKPVSRRETPTKDVYDLHRDIFLALRNKLRTLQYSRRTEKSYEHWVRRFIEFHGAKSPTKLTADAVRNYLEYLAEERKVSASTQNQALNALVFLFEQVFGEPLGAVGEFTRAKQPGRVPDVLSKEEVGKLFNQLRGVKALITGLLYGSGLRLMECLRLRVKDIDFEQKKITVRDGKGQKDRLTILPELYIRLLHEHLEKVRLQHEKDLELGCGAVYLWPTLEKKHPDAAIAWEWQYVFPARRLSVEPGSGKVRRHHIHESGVQKAVRDAANRAGLAKEVSCNSLRHSFAAHLLEGGYGLQTVQKLLGHADAAARTIYTHVMKQDNEDIRSPID